MISIPKDFLRAMMPPTVWIGPLESSPETGFRDPGGPRTECHSLTSGDTVKVTPRTPYHSEHTHLGVWDSPAGGNLLATTEFFSEKISEKICTWPYNDLDDYFGTSCGHDVCFEDEMDPEYRFCPYCGKELSLERNSPSNCGGPGWGPR